MRILWFSNVILTQDATKSTGTWLRTMSDALVERGVELCNITQNDCVNDITRKDSGSIKQWVLPVYKLHNGLPSKHHIQEICEIVDEVAPDVIHIWGVEAFWGLLSAKGYLKGNVLLEIQGIKETCTRVFYGGLTWRERLSTIGIRELLRPSMSLQSQRRSFVRWSRFEREMLSGNHHISTHSDWVRAWIAQFIHPDCQIYHTQRIVRKEFLETEIWKKPHNPKDAPVVFSMSSGADAYKGIHDGIKAIAVLKQYYPKIELRVAGNFGIEKPFYRKPGYTKYLLNMMNKLGVENNVVFLGSLNAKQIIEQIHQSDVMLQTSYVESYSLAVSEAMMAGVPLVVSFAGAMPELAQDKAAALFYTPSDYFACAYRLMQIIEDEKLSNDLSLTARNIAEKRNVASVLGGLQIDIYNKVLSDKR